MRQPLWILNSILFILLVFVLLFMFFSQVTIDERTNIKPDSSKVGLEKGVSKINIEKIYEDDLFKTFIKKAPPKVEEVKVPSLPSPPRPALVRIPPAPEPKFLDPLDITLKGIVAIGDGTDSSAMIADNKTKREAVYKVGDKIEDAQLIRIFNSKVIFVRSNGQQEVFYLREQDAQSDPVFLNIDNWDGIVKKGPRSKKGEVPKLPNKYFVSPAMFAGRIKSLAQFIDILGLTSAYHQGKGIGCRIGDVVKNSLGYKLGLKTGDIVLRINDIPPTNTKNRLKIYNKLISLKEDDTIIVKLQRRRAPYTLIYELKDFRPAQKVTLTAARKVAPEKIKEERRKMLEQKYEFAPTARQIRARERQNMLQRGRRPVARGN